MMFLVFSLLGAFLQVNCHNPQSHWTLLPNILVLQVDGTLGQHPLSCLAEDLLKRDSHTQEIFWRRNGIEEAQRGNLYKVQLVESLGGGNYTCHHVDGTLLNHTEVLILQDESKRRRILVKTKQEFLKCSTKNYNGEFHCSWTWHSSRVGRVAFIKARRVSDDNGIQCSVDGSGQHWMCTSARGNFSCSVDDSGSGVSCRDEQHCPFAEENQPIHMTVYVRTDHFLMEIYSKLFFLSEIVKPDKVRIGKVNTTVVEWSYPSSWNMPYSYFPLTFQIFQVKGNCGKFENPCVGSKSSKALTLHSTDICQFKVKHKVKAVCVRAKDALYDSEWSEWSHVRLKRTVKRKKYKQH
ncbi:interleukin 12Ba [Nematolebias whitei]|uniref:interleukin 12Ba n=1 Tax=Nematolebias whitei TaxID=451745 RepID=UPI001896A9DD|nr:interleukin 12Ba [Nematolebias whitei]